MKQTFINNLKDRIGEEVTLKGWLYNARSSGKLVFLQLRDGSGIVQCVVFKGNDEAVFERAKTLGQESSIVVHGSVKADERSPIGNLLSLERTNFFRKIFIYDF
jgi:asparaginyl-tRNA synthetase